MQNFHLFAQDRPHEEMTNENGKWKMENDLGATDPRQPNLNYLFRAARRLC